MLFTGLGLSVGPRSKYRPRPTGSGGTKDFGHSFSQYEPFVIVKTCSSFLNYVSSTSLDISLKVSSSERRRVVLLMESVQISPCGCICERKES